MQPSTGSFLAGLLISMVALGAQAGAEDGPIKRPRLRAAALEFAITPPPGGATASRTGAMVQRVAGPLKTTVTLLEDGGLRVCLATTHFNSPKAVNVSRLFRRAIAGDLGLPLANVLLCVSHNHSDQQVAENQVEAYLGSPQETPEPKLLPVGQELLDKLRSHAKRLPGMLQPVTVWWAQGSEGRITYNRKGRRADGSTYFMREEDRELLEADFRGDIDREAPIVVLKNRQNELVAAIVQFTGHPVTCYHPEKPVVFGDWPQVACDMVAERLSPSKPLAVSFLQGCAGDVNSKGMFRGNVELSTQYGRMLGQSYLEATKKLARSQRDGLRYAAETVRIPLAPLPSEETLRAEAAEMRDFVGRAAAGDPNTLSCVGLNFPRDLTPAFRGKLVEAILPWSCWALDLRRAGRADRVATYLEAELYVIRLGDVGIVGMPCEPFQGIGRQMRRRSPLPLTIPCGYVNTSYGYITDSANTGDREYVSAFYRYTRFRAPLKKPAGDVFAEKALTILRRFAIAQE